MHESLGLAWYNVKKHAVIRLICPGIAAIRGNISMLSVLCLQAGVFGYLAYLGLLYLSSVASEFASAEMRRSESHKRSSWGESSDGGSG